MGLKPRKNMSRRTVSIKPCFKVTLNVSIDRGVKYRQMDHNVEANADGSEDAEWRTHRHYKDRDEAKAADRVFSAVRQKLHSIGTHTALGFVVPLEDEAKLDKALQEMEEAVDEANKGFRYCHINLEYDVVEYTNQTKGAAKSVASQIERSAQRIQEALREFNPKNARKVLNASKEVLDVLADPKARKALHAAREQARELAGEIQAVVKQFDGNVQDAMQSESGKELLVRANAKWNF